MWLAIVISETVIILILILIIWMMIQKIFSSSSENLVSIKQAWNLALTGKQDPEVQQAATSQEKNQNDPLYSWDEKNLDPMLATLQREGVESESELALTLQRMRAQDSYYNQPEMDDLAREQAMGSPNPFSFLTQDPENDS